MPTSNKSIISQFFSGTVFIGIARISTILLGLVSVMLATRYLTKDAYGAYVLVMLFGNFLVHFMNFGLGLAIPKYLASHEEDEEYKTTLINTVLHFRIFVVLIVLLFITVFRPFIASFFDSEMSIDIFIATSIIFLLLSFTTLFESILRGFFKFEATGILEFISEISELVLLILFVVVYQLGFWGLLLAKIIAQMIWMILAFWVIKPKYRWQFNISILKEMLRFGFPLQMQYIFGFAHSKLDTLLVGSFLGTSGIALYDIARKIPDSLDQLYSVFISVYFPLSANVYATEKNEKTNFIINNSIRLLTVLAFFATLVTIFFGKDIIVLLFSEQYLPAYWAMVILMLGFTLQMIEATLGYSLVAIGEPDKSLYINIVRFVVSLACNLAILPILGFTGAALVTIIGGLVAIPLNIFFLRKKNISPKLFDFLKLTLIVGVLFSLFLIWGQAAFLTRLFFLLLYIPLCFLLTVITMRDVSIVLGEIRSIRLNFKKNSKRI